LISLSYRPFDGTQNKLRPVAKIFAVVAGSRRVLVVPLAHRFVETCNSR
jgi:hypothetical protein